MAKPDPDASHNVHPDRYCGCQKNSFGERRTHEQIDDQGLTVVQMNIPLCNSDDDNDDHHDQDIDCGGDDDDVVVRDNDLLVNSSSPRYGDKATDLGNNVSFQIRSLTTRINDDRGRCGLTNTQERAILVGFLIGLSLGLLYVSWVLISRHFHNRTNGDDVNPVLLDVNERYNDSSLPASILDDVSQKDSIIATIRRPLFIAVLTQKKFLSTRGAACNLTWAQSSYVTDVEFFTEENEPSMSSLRHGNIVTYLTGTYRDDYFHARKTFSVIGEICSRHLESHDWFMLSTDDVYVRVNQLHLFISKRDPDDKFYFGHKTYPVHDRAYTFLDGQPYCMTGPGIVLSRRLMTELCKVLTHCVSPPQHVMLYPDIVLAKCLRDHLNVTCTGYNKLFVDTYEEREMKRLRHFLEHDEGAITLHPVKSRWTMTALHTQHTERTMRHLLEAFRSLEERRRMLDNLTNILSTATEVNRVETLKTSMTKEVADPIVEEEAVFDENMLIYKRDWCKPVEYPTPALHTDLKKVSHLANTSLQLGEGLHCPYLLSGCYKRHERGATYTVDFVCFKVGSPEPHVIAHVTAERTLKSLVTKKIRRRKLKPEMVVIVSTWQHNPDLFPYMVRLNGVIKTRNERYTIYLLLRDDEDPEYGKESFKSDFPDNEKWKTWWSGSGLTHRVYRQGKHDLVRSLQYLVRDVRTRFPDATAIVTDTDTPIDSELIMKCRTLARKGKQMYYPFPVVPTMADTDHGLVVGYSLLTNSRRPYCINTADLDTLLVVSTDSLLSSTIGRLRKRLKVIRATDFALRGGFVW